MVHVVERKVVVEFSPEIQVSFIATVYIDETYPDENHIIDIGIDFTDIMLNLENIDQDEATIEETAQKVAELTLRDLLKQNPKVVLTTDPIVIKIGNDKLK